MYSVRSKGRLIHFNEPHIMGIINCTTDSFYAGNRLLEHDWKKMVEKHIQEGATIIDVGGQSTRPGSERITAEEEIQRVIPAINYIRTKYPTIIISIDTFYSEVAEQAVLAGADMINDVTGGSKDENIFQVAGRMQVPYILTHLKGELDNMQENPTYEDLITEMLQYFIDKIEICKAAGIQDIILDMGFGFGKTLDHNYQILHSLKSFKIFKRPILVGVSRKSMVQKLLGVDASAALNGTTVLHTIALQKGVEILRVHDVKEAREVREIVSKINSLKISPSE